MRRGSAWSPAHGPHECVDQPPGPQAQAEAQLADRRLALDPSLCEPRPDARRRVAVLGAVAKARDGRRARAEEVLEVGDLEGGLDRELGEGWRDEGGERRVDKELAEAGMGVVVRDGERVEGEVRDGPQRIDERGGDAVGVVAADGGAVSLALAVDAQGEGPQRGEAREVGRRRRVELELEGADRVRRRRKNGLEDGRLETSGRAIDHKLLELERELDLGRLGHVRVAPVVLVADDA